MINIFYPPAHLKRQIDVLRDKMGMDDAPKVSDLKKGFINIIQIDSIQKQPPKVFYKKEVLKVLQNSQENICTIVSFLINLQASGQQLY